MGLKWMKTSVPVKSPGMPENASFPSICSCTCIKTELNQWDCSLPSGLSSNAFRNEIKATFKSSFFFFVLPLLFLLEGCLWAFFLQQLETNVSFQPKLIHGPFKINLCQCWFLTRAGFLVPTLTYLSEADPYQLVFLCLNKLYSHCLIIKLDFWNLITGEHSSSLYFSLK